MPKIEFPPATILYPMPAVLVGAMVKGKPNFLTVAYAGIVNIKPPMIGVSLNQAHYTNQGIHEHKSFSVNVPSASMAAAVDYCGLNSGHRVDKSQVFKVFFGKLETAPLIEEAPLNLECRLVQTIPLDPDELMIGEIVSVFVDSERMTGGLPDLRKIDPLVFSGPEKKYYRVGEEVGKAWSMGKDFKPAAE